MDFDEYFQSCERDTCSCDSGGDCECFCSNVAAYAAACKVAGVCVKWRTPSICRESPSLLPHQELNKKNLLKLQRRLCCNLIQILPTLILLLCVLLTHLLSLSSAIFCDYYNPSGECEWHYEPCGKPCQKTCKNPSGKCDSRLPALEGTDHRVLSSLGER